MMKSHTARLTQDLRNIVNDIDHLISANTNGASRLRSQMTHGYDVARDRLSDLNDTVVTRGKRAARYADGYARHRPWQAIGIGALSGLVAGILISRR